jgi:hypothetical protein
MDIDMCFSFFEFMEEIRAIDQFKALQPAIEIVNVTHNTREADQICAAPPFFLHCPLSGYFRP